MQHLFTELFKNEGRSTKSNSWGGKNIFSSKFEPMCLVRQNIWLLTWAPVWNDVLWHKTPNHPGRTSTYPWCWHRCNLHIVFGTTPGEPSKIPSYCRSCAKVRLFLANVIQFMVPCVTEGRESLSHRLLFDDWARARQHPMIQAAPYIQQQPVSEPASYTLAHFRK